MFLHALNVQMLVTEFGGLEHCPTTITWDLIFLFLLFLLLLLLFPFLLFLFLLVPLYLEH